MSLRSFHLKIFKLNCIEVYVPKINSIYKFEENRMCIFIYVHMYVCIKKYWKNKSYIITETVIRKSYETHFIFYFNLKRKHFYYIFIY